MYVPPIFTLHIFLFSRTELNDHGGIFLAANAATYTLGFDTMMADLNCTTFQATIGVSTYCLGFGIVPLFTASFSEEFGRRPLYVASSIGFLLMHIMAAL